MTLMLSRHNLHAYQNRAVDFVLSERRCMLALEMGLGKSVSTLTAISDMLDGFTARRVLVIAPLRVANSVWAQETRRWAHLNHLAVSVCTGSDKARRAALCVDADIYVINRENVPWLVENYGNAWDFDVVVIDESSSFKNASSKRFKALRKMLPHIESIILLTGTPSPNGLLDLWSQMYLVDYGERLGRTLTGYKTRFFEADYFGRKFELRNGSAEKIHSLVSDKVIHMSADDYLDMPARIDLAETVDLGKALPGYKDFERTMLAELDDGKEVEASTAAVLANKLMQYCIAENTLVITKAGAKPIQNVTCDDLVWDGVEYVKCCGSLYMGKKVVINCYGVRMTPDHKVLTADGWLEAQETFDGNARQRLDRKDVQLPYNIEARRDFREWTRNLAMSLHLRKTGCSSKPKPSFKESQNQVVWMQTRGGGGFNYAWHDLFTSTSDMEQHKAAVRKPFRQGLGKLRGARDNCLRKMAIFSEILGRYARRLFRQFDFGSYRQQPWLLQRELPLVNCFGSGAQHAKKCDDRYTRWPYEFDISGGALRDQSRDASCSNFSLQMAEKPMVRKTYDIVNCGPRNRFVVLDDQGQGLIVHNCNGALYTDAHGSWSETHVQKLDALSDIVEDNPSENMLVAYNYKSDLERLLKRFPQAKVLDKNQSTIDDWNKGKIPILLAHPASAGHGLNLQDGGALCVWFGLNWSLELYQQFNARLHRQGQKRPVRIVHIVADNTIDARVLAVLKNKDATQSSLLNALKP
jgi:hypothetical protein